MELLRPGWLADDDEWTKQLAAMTADDVEWFSRAWELTDGPRPRIDTSWVTTELRR